MLQSTLKKSREIDRDIEIDRHNKTNHNIISLCGLYTNQIYITSFLLIKILIYYSLNDITTFLSYFLTETWLIITKTLEKTVRLVSINCCLIFKWTI